MPWRTFCHFVLGEGEQTEKHNRENLKEDEENNKNKICLLVPLLEKKLQFLTHEVIAICTVPSHSKKNLFLKQLVNDFSGVVFIAVSSLFWSVFSASYSFFSFCCQLSFLPCLTLFCFLVRMSAGGNSAPSPRLPLAIKAARMSAPASTRLVTELTVWHGLSCHNFSIFLASSRSLSVFFLFFPWFWFSLYQSAFLWLQADCDKGPANSFLQTFRDRNESLVVQALSIKSFTCSAGDLWVQIRSDSLIELPLSTFVLACSYENTVKPFLASWLCADSPKDDQWPSSLSFLALFVCPWEAPHFCLFFANFCNAVHTCLQVMWFSW